MRQMNHELARCIALSWTLLVLGMFGLGIILANAA